MASPTSRRCSTINSRCSESSTCRDDELPGRKMSKAGKDLLGSLPESMIYHIFSFLDTKDIIRTSALSRRWRFFWTESPTISLDYGDLEEHDDDDPDYCWWVDRILDSSTALTIYKFHLTVPYSHDMKKSVDRWMSFAVVRHVQDLRLDLLPYYDDDDDDVDDDYENNHYVLPVVTFSCQSVVRLLLRMCDFSVLHAAGCRISWNSLKVLRIEEAALRDYMMDSILKGSPVLESIVLEDCSGISHVRIRSTSLRELSINGYRDHPGGIDQSTLEISTPNLKLLKLLGECGRNMIVKLREVSSLADAELNLDMTEYEGWEDAACLVLEGILRESHGIDRLVLGSCFLKALRILEKKDDYNLAELNCRDLILRPAFHGQIQDVHGIVTALKYSRVVTKFVIDLTPEDSIIEPICSRRYRTYFYEDPFDILNGRETTLMAKRLQRVEVMGVKLNDLSELICWLPLVKFLIENGLLPPQTIIHASKEVSRLLKRFKENEVLSYEKYPIGFEGNRLMLCHLKFGLSLFFGGFVLVMAVFVYFFIPETKGIPIEEMGMVWKNHWYWKRFVGEDDFVTPSAHAHNV